MVCWWVGAACGVWGALKACVSPLVDGARSWGSWLIGPMCLRAGVGLLVDGLGPATAGCGAAVVLGLVPTYSWVRPRPRGSWGWFWPGRWSLVLTSLAAGHWGSEVGVLTH